MNAHSDDTNIDITEALGPFGQMEDPRKSRATRHLFQEMLFIALASVLAGGEGLVDMEEFAKSKKDWLETFMELPKGIPSHDAFGDLFALLDPEEFNVAFVEWTQDLRAEVSQEVIAVDGRCRHPSANAPGGGQAGLP